MTDHTPDPARGARVYATDRAHVFHSWSAQQSLKPLVIEGAEGCYVWDFDGNRYLDFSSQLVNTNIGHQHPKVIAAIAEQAGKLTTVAPQHANEARGQAAERLTSLAPAGFSKVFFTNGGADANENAIRMAQPLVRLEQHVRHDYGPWISPLPGMSYFNFTPSNQLA